MRNKWGLHSTSWQGKAPALTRQRHQRHPGKALAASKQRHQPSECKALAAKQARYQPQTWQDTCHKPGKVMAAKLARHQPETLRQACCLRWNINVSANIWGRCRERHFQHSLVTLVDSALPPNGAALLAVPQTEACHVWPRCAAVSSL